MTPSKIGVAAKVTRASCYEQCPGEEQDPQDCRDALGVTRQNEGLDSRYVAIEADLDVALSAARVKVWGQAFQVTKDAGPHREHKSFAKPR
ncbi:MAG: hypothetical protein M3325_15960 [Actinomycetota bacterium]|nr:hypothetical protein [Actinomycetota bacterium]